MTDDILSGTKRIGVKRTDRSVEVSPRGYLVAGKITEELQEILLALAEDDLDSIVINLEETEHIDSWGLGVLVVARQKTQERETRLVLCNLNRRVQDILKIMKLRAFFNLEEDPKSDSSTE
jgi:anti-anti-sigma factor